jgi:hypothetical protein
MRLGKRHECIPSERIDRFLGQGTAAGDCFIPEIAFDLGPWNRFIIDWVTAKLTGEEVEKKVGVPTTHTFFSNIP